MFAAFIPMFMGALAMAMGSLIGRAILVLGIGFVTYTGIDLALGAMLNAVIGGVRNIGGDAVMLLGYLWVDKAISVMSSAVVASVAMRGVGGAVKRMIFK